MFHSEPRSRAATLRFALLLVFAAAWSLPAEAQQGFQQYSRALFPSSQVLGMGGAGVAYASPETAFFYNPAHFSTVGRRPRIEVLGVRGEVSRKVFEDIDFYFDRIEPAIEEGIEESSLTQEQRDLFNDALTQGARPSVGQLGVLAPSVMVKLGPIAGGAGAFANTTARYRFEDGGGIPIIDLYAQGDAMGVVGFGGAIPGTGVSAGFAGKYVRRFLSTKNKSLLDIDPNDEEIYILEGTTVTFDAGLQYTDVFKLLPGSLDLGVAIYDIVGGQFDYQLFDNIDLTQDDTGESTDDEQTDIAEVNDAIELFNARDGDPSFRVGAAYSVPALDALPFVRDVAVALDYVSESTSDSDQPALSKLRFGGQATLGGLLALRGGISQGYPTAGVGLQTRVFRLDYVFYGIEDGRLPGQVERYNHFVQVRFGLF